MPRSTDWTRDETLAAFHIYLQLPFGQLHRNQPRIVQLSQWIGRTASAVAMKLVNLASLDPQIVASGRRGMGNASKLDQQIWNEFLAANDPVVTEAAMSFGHYAEQNGLPPFVDVLDEVPEIAEGKTTTAIVQVRVNQARFRRAILASYNATCCMSGLRVPQLLVASHIVPWSMDSQNRLNPSNGLCLSALHDRAYDQGLITVLPDSPSAWAKRCVTPSWTRLHKAAWRNAKGKPFACLNDFGLRLRFWRRMRGGLGFCEWVEFCVLTG